MHSQWGMEFDVEGADYFHEPLKTVVENPEIPISRLYYWCPETVVYGTTEKVMLCTVPLIGEAGKVFGVCGFEVSKNLFHLSYSETTQNTPRKYNLIFQTENGEKPILGSCFYGNVSLENFQDLEIIKKENGRFVIGEKNFLIWECKKNFRFIRTILLMKKISGWRLFWFRKNLITKA
jgi:hypothetical protein